MDDEQVFLYTYRYMWKVKDSKTILVRIITDTIEGLSAFEEALLKNESIYSCAKEYLFQCDVSRIGLLDSLKFEDSDVSKPVSSRDFNGGKD